MKNVMGIIIAVIGLAIFFAGVYGLYQVNKSQAAENARKTLDSIMGKAELLQDGENNTFVIQGFKGGDDWYLVGWSKEEGRLEGKPDKCFDKSCICICRGANKCQENGFCEDVEKTQVNIFIPPFRGSYRYSGGGTLAQQCILFSDKLMEFFISKSSEEIIISSFFVGERKDEGKLIECREREGGKPGVILIPTIIP